VCPGPGCCLWGLRGLRTLQTIWVAGGGEGVVSKE